MKWLNYWIFGAGWLRMWRWVAPAAAIFYLYFAFDAALDGDRLTVAVNVLIAAVYLFTAGKAHSTVKRYYKKNKDQ